MKFTTAKEHRDFFHKNHAIEFTELLNPQVCKDLSAKIDQTFMAAHDLWRMNESFRKVIMLPRLAEIASELIEKRPLRIGYDQLFLGIHKSSLNSQQQNIYGEFLKHTYTLNEISSLQGVLCGLMLCLSGSEKLSIEEEVKKSLFSLIPGNGVYFSPNCPIDFPTLANLQGYRYLMIVYVHSTTLYILNEKDPYTHFLKKLGYVFGDKLLDKQNPIIYR